MAEPTEFAEANLLLIAPAGLEADVMPLPVRRDGGQIVSCWMLSADDIREIAETGCVWLSVWSKRSAPPVLVTGRKSEVIAA